MICVHNESDAYIGRIIAVASDDDDSFRQLVGKEALPNCYLTHTRIRTLVWLVISSDNEF